MTYKTKDVIGVAKMSRAFTGMFAAALALLATSTAFADKSSATDPYQIKYTGPMAEKPEATFSIQANEPFAQTGGFTVDVSNRQHVQSFFNAIYTASENTPMAFSGSQGMFAPFWFRFLF